MHLRPTPSLPSETRLARLGKWLLLTITGFCAHALAVLAPSTARRWLSRHRRYALVLLVVRALKRTPPPLAQRRHSGLRPCRNLTIRRIAGAAVRRALRSHRRESEVHALYAALTQPEQLVLRIVRRLMRRFTKLRALPALDRRSAPFATLHAEPTRADTS